MLYLKAAAVFVYIAAVVVANWVTDRFGFVPVGFGVTATAGTYAAGIALLSRDLVQDLAGRRTVLAAIAVGGALSAWLATPQLALASGVAFLVAETTDMAVYTPLRKRGWARAVLASNAVGAVLDTVLFLWLAGFPIAAAVPGQLIGKIVWATLVPVVAVTLVRQILAARRRREVEREVVETG
ncbi:VUT family protein [Spirillospora sp. NPDC127200]